MYQAGLVLEGGGMRGMYTAGVLDFFLDKEIEFSKCYGVSAGACHMCSYLSKQRGRSYHVWTDYLECSDYCSMKSLLRTGDLFNKDFCYDLIPEYLNPMDYETFRKYPGKAYAVAANIATGKAEYLRLAGTQKDCEAVRASSSLPLISRNVRLGDQLYLDGGLADSIPIRKSILDGNRKNVVVLTKEVGYRKEPSSHLGLVKLRYLRYPKVYEMMKVRHIVYNRTLDYLEKQVQNGQAFVIRPSYAMGINRIEKDKEKLKALYQQGYDEAAAQYDRLMEYLEK
ncbi:MAG: patatin family protein [Lachnospiraceae bacterium]|nr:patatin family protein [Lachnospiraceae bacterium]